MYVLPVAIEGEEELAGLTIPEPQGVIPTSCDHLAVVGADRAVRYDILVA